MKRALLYIILFVCTYASAQLHVAGIFADNAIIQQDIQIPVWGKSNPGDTISVSIGNNESKCVTDENGRWFLKLQKMKADGKSYKMIIKSANQVVSFENIKVGEVWFASGQSNMQWKIKDGVVNKDQEIKNADFPDIRICTVDFQTSSQPMDDISQQKWKSCDSENVKDFSAVSYFFARELYLDKMKPVGIIVSARGATNIETWISRERLMTHPDYTEKLLKTETDTASWNQKVRYSIKAERDREIIANTSISGLKMNVHKLTFNDKSWAQTEYPLNMSKMGYPNFWGLIWIRKTFEITSKQYSDKWKLVLPVKDQNDRIYINGKEIARDVSKMKEKTLDIKSGLLKNGKNLLAIRMYVNWGSAEIGNSNSSCYLISESGNKVVLDGNWHHNNKIEPEVAQWQDYYNNDNVNFNAMINPLIPYGIRGFLWYQGENNVSHFKQYAELQPMLIDDWRVRWRQGYLPFLFVQLANYKEQLIEPVDKDELASFRHAQESTLHRSQNTGMACTIDIGDNNEIHPRNKQEVGKRLYLIAKNMVYGDSVVYSGPVYKSIVKVNNGLIISFYNADSGLKTYDNKPVNGFAICNKDGKWSWSEAQISGNDIFIRCDSSVSSVQYAWQSNPDCNLYNSAGLPAVPFKVNIK